LAPAEGRGTHGCDGFLEEDVGGEGADKRSLTPFL
jgi:hypothetical protein